MNTSFQKIWLFLIFVLLISFTVTSQTGIIEKGISAALAVARKKAISSINYQLDLTIPSQRQEEISASETISFVYKKQSLPLQLDFKEKQQSLKTVVVNGLKVPAVFKNEHIVIAAKYLRQGMNTIAIGFIAGDLSLNRNEDYLYTLLVPDRARTVFPCFDQPDLKATFKLSLNIPKSWNALSNAPLVDSVVTGASKTYRYESSDTISTYLFSFAAGAFKKITRNVNGRVMNFYHRETDTTKIRLSTDSIFMIHADALKFLEEYTQIPFPFKKFDFIAIPDFQYGGMEHVGAIQYRASSLFLDSGATKDQENARSNLIAHETSHMWFGDMVTMQWFNDVWTKEVFANFIADKITRGKQHDNNYELKFLTDHYPAAYAVDRTAGANPIRQPLSNLQEAGTLYGNIIYHKAPVMMRQLELLMGKDAFRDGLREYLKKYKYSNANWPQLIQIFSKYTVADLGNWNKVWVNEPGRSVFSYALAKNNNRISALTIDQDAENGSSNLLPQSFKIALVYTNRTEEFRINMNQKQTIVNEVKGKPIPDFILFNAAGEGYGLFPVDSNMVTRLTIIKNPVMRASAYVNMYENMHSENIPPKVLMTALKSTLSSEPEELNVKLMTGYLSEIFWRLTLPAERITSAPGLEKQLWRIMQLDTVANKKKLLFKTFQSIALTKAATDTLYAIWQKQKAPAGVTLSEEDYTSIALNLALKNYPDSNLLQQELRRIKNPDRKKRLQYIMPALSSDVRVRDSFFNALKEEKNREKEAWVTIALDYLHHPLRAATSVKYLQQSLELLQEIQSTGDIFFPGAWLQATFGSYQTPEAANIVRRFLKNHPDYNPKLRAKILQATDPLFRAEKLLYATK